MATKARVERPWLWTWAHNQYGTKWQNTGDPEMDRDEHSGECEGCAAYYHIMAWIKAQTQ